MRPLLIAAVAAVALAACEPKPEPAAPPPVAASDAPGPTAPKGSEERRSQLREESAERQLEAQMRDLQIEPAPAR